MSTLEKMELLTLIECLSLLKTLLQTDIILMEGQGEGIKAYLRIKMIRKTSYQMLDQLI